MNPLLDRFLAGLLIFCIGLVLRRFDKLKEDETKREIEEYRNRYFRRPRTMAFLDLAHAALGSYGPKIVQLILSPLLAWILMILGAVYMGDAILLMSKQNY